MTGLPPVDGVNVWPQLIGQNSSAARLEIHLGNESLIVGRHKVVTGVQPMTGWTGPTYPNNTGPQPQYFPVLTWKYDCGSGCLYDIEADPTEHVNLASSQPELLANLTQRLAELNQGNQFPNRGKPTLRACERAVLNGGYYGPFEHL